MADVDIGLQILLFKATKQGNAGMVSFLLNTGSDPNSIATGTGQTPLHAAACWNRLKIAELLLANGAYPNARNVYGVSPLLCAANGGHHLMARLLVQNGAEVDLPDVIGRTPLFCAVSNGHRRVIRVLIRYGADVPAVNKARQTIPYDVSANPVDVWKMVEQRYTPQMTGGVFEVTGTELN